MDVDKMKDIFDSQAEAYNSLLKGVCPVQNALELASVICSAVCGGLVPVLVQDARNLQPMDYSQWGSDLTCTAMTLVENMSSKLASQSLSPEACLYFMEVSRLLFQEMDLMSKLGDLFQAEDRLVSHLAAKTVSTCVFYQLKSTGAVCPVWEQRCVKAFQNASPCHELDACLWSLTSVLKRILKGHGKHQTEVLEKVLTPFDPALSALCSKLLPGERQGGEIEEGGGEEEETSTPWSPGHPDRATTLSALLALLELLTAARYTACLPGQRLACTRTPALLRAVSSSCSYSVKKQVLLLLKRTLLQRAGEDMSLGASASRDGHLATDMAAVADAVLQAVRAGWLRRVPVEEAASYFGGSGRTRVEGGPTADYVMLRAVGLVLLKSMVLQIPPADRKGTLAGVDVPGCLQALLLFLAQRGVVLGGHPCSWLTLVFGDQDDDMMEAAMALLCLHQHHSAPSGQEAACSSGSNPHCHFLFLLRSLSFDSSILLDFLISAETCFLEYFVRYLKHLRADGGGFSAACGRVGGPDRRRLEASCGSGVSARRCAAPPSGVPGPVQPSVRGPSDHRSSGTSPASGLLRLVDYGSSDDSDPEDMDVSDAPLDQDGSSRSQETGSCDLGPTPGSILGSGQSPPPVHQSPSLVHQSPPPVHQSPPPVHAQTEHGLSHSAPWTGTGPALGPDTWTRGGLRPTASGRASRPQATGGQTTTTTPWCADVTGARGPCPRGTGARPGSSGRAARSGAAPGGEVLSARVTSCLAELAGVVARLQGNGLFPYNATSLLRLLAQVQNPSQNRGPLEVQIQQAET